MSDPERNEHMTDAEVITDLRTPKPAKPEPDTRYTRSNLAREGFLVVVALLALIGVMYLGAMLTGHVS